MLVEFDDVEFVFSHGRSPRGYGAWAFSTRRHPDVGVAGPEGVLWAPTSSFSEAKRWARDEIRRLVPDGAACTLYVLP